MNHRRAIDTIRLLAVDAVEGARSGHPGMPMGAAPMAYVLWTEFLRHNPSNPHWPNRDRFVLSAGHGSMLLYALLYLTGYDLPLEELKRFRQWGSRTPGHPERELTPGVEVTTGPLGQGLATAVGIAAAGKHLAARYNRPGFALFDYRVFVLASDGDLMEGVTAEASALAGHWRLDNLIVLYDDNRITIDGPTELAWSEDVMARYRAYGWYVRAVPDGNHLGMLRKAIRGALEAGRPALLKVRTHIGYGSPNKQDTAKAHGEPLGPEEVRLVKERFGFPPDEAFVVEEPVLRYFRQALRRGRIWENRWNKLLARYRKAYPQEARELEELLTEGGDPSCWWEARPRFEPGTNLATRAASGKTLEAILPRMPFLVGGSADLTPSNNTRPEGTVEDFQQGRYAGRYFRFGVREHAMAAIANGLALSGLRPYVGTFLVFSDYMRPAIRMAALSQIPTIFVCTHDSIGLGEDGPTHQPVEHLASLRAMPNCWLVRPADANETVYAWRIALERRDGPTVLALTRQAVPVLEGTDTEAVLRGGYVLRDAPGPQVVLIATGSEVALALAAWERLRQEGIAARVVSLPCWELFEAQPEAYRRAVLPPGVPKLAIEAGSTLGWDRYADAVLGLDRFGASAPQAVLWERFGFTPERVLERVRALLRAYGGLGADGCSASAVSAHL
ncbi:MAG: transketolase [Bacteroidetes bacterium]|nr:transketolase [Rhodothermia bacterium]MCS7154637.1 transketolase [Bacteroidota bacterium]MCX7906354.1 transketolase [Bacteroidota bacterium]MDW8137430.1 transketolase [Bacteroidota bacterium]MDW8285616.1 transketolase [Bacteroidota bacterium]